MNLITIGNLSVTATCFREIQGYVELDDADNMFASDITMGFFFRLISMDINR